MSESGTDWETYDYYLTRRGTSDRRQSIHSANASFKELASSSPSYQPTAKCNGITKPMLAVRESTQICKVSLFPEDSMCIGDIVTCYDENWLVMELYKDEFGLVSGEMWLCNHLFRFQNNSSEIIERYGVVDDGTYSTLSEKSITTADAKYCIYMPLDEQTDRIYIDKRFSIGTMYDQDQEKILQVMKVTWIDKINQNVGEGSHLLKLQTANDIYNKETDNLSQMLCDYIDNDEDEHSNNDSDESDENDKGLILISGKNTIRIGSSREYFASLVDADGNDINEEIKFIWSVNSAEVKIEFDKSVCKLTVPYNDSLIGEEITLSVRDEDNRYLACDKVIEVVTIG